MLCLFNGSKWRQQTRKPWVTSGVTRRQSRVYFVDCKGILTPILRTWVQKSTLLLQNRGHAEVLKKTPSSAKYVTKVRPPSVPECPPPPGAERRRELRKTTHDERNDLIYDFFHTCRTETSYKWSNAPWTGLWLSR